MTRVWNAPVSLEPPHNFTVHAVTFSVEKALDIPMPFYSAAQSTHSSRVNREALTFHRV
jgi:hypothetical protein